MRSAIYILVTSVFAFFLLITPNSIFADEAKLGVQVDHIAGVFEKLSERISLMLKFDDSGKYNFYKYLADKRLAELEYVVNDKLLDDIEPTSSRYTTYLGVLTNFIIAHNLKNRGGELAEMFKKHRQILEKLNIYPANSAYWLLMLHAINSTDIYLNQIRDLK